MKKLGKIRTLAIASLSALAIATPIALAQTAGTGQENKQVTSGEHRGRDKRGGDRQGRGGWGGGEGRGGRMHGMMLEGVTLTDDQKAKMKTISQSFRERTQSLHKQIQANRQGLRQASDGGTFNEALATQKLQESAALEAKLMAEQFNMRQQMLSVLTPEQRTQLEQKRAEFKAKRAQHGGRKVQ